MSVAPIAYGEQGDPGCVSGSGVQRPDRQDYVCKSEFGRCWTGDGCQDGQDAREPLQGASLAANPHEKPLSPVRLSCTTVRKPKAGKMKAA